MNSNHQLKRISEVLTKLHEADIDQRRDVQAKLAFARVPNLRVSEKFSSILTGMAERELLKKLLLATRVTIPHVAPAAAIPLGPSLHTRQPIVIHKNVPCRHALLIGSSGSGKSTLDAHLISWAYLHNVQSLLSDHKGCEGPRLLNLFEDVLILKPDQITENLFAPPSRELAKSHYSALFAEFARAYGLVPITATQLLTIMERVEKGMRPGQDWPSFCDFERILHRQGEYRKKFSTAAHCFAALNCRLGPAAAIRRGVKPDVKIVVFNWHGCPPREHQFLSALLLVRSQMEAMTTGFSSDLNTLYFSDEGLMEFGREFAQSAGSGYVSVWKRDITQMRAYGRGIVACVQSISQVDDILKANCGTVFVFKTPDPHEAAEALQLIGAPTAWIPKVQNLAPGQAFVRSEGFSGPVLVQLPFVELGDYPSDADVARRMAPKFAALEKDIARSPIRESGSPIFFDDEKPTTPETEVLAPAPEPAPVEEEVVLSADHVALLIGIQEHPHASVSERYHMLQFSAGKGNRLKVELLAQGLVVVVKRKVGNHAPLKILKLTDTGRKVISTKPSHPSDSPLQATPTA